MGLLGKFKRRLKNQLKVDDSTFASYDMTEIGDSNSDDSIEEQRRKRRPKRFLSPLSSPSGHSHSSRTPLIVDQVPPMIDTSSIESPTALAMAEMGDTAKAILNEAFPHISFDERIPDEDLSQYPDPEIMFCISPTPSEDRDDDDDDATFKGLLIDTSDQENQPSEACENDEYLVSSPANNDETTNTNSTSNSPLPITSSSSPTTQQQQQQPRTKNLAHIFHEELSTLMEEDEGSLSSVSETNSTEDNDIAMVDESEPVFDMSPMEKSIRDRWNHILVMTITGQCADRHAVVDEAEI